MATGAQFCREGSPICPALAQLSDRIQPYFTSFQDALGRIVFYLQSKVPPREAISPTHHTFPAVRDAQIGVAGRLVARWMRAATAVGALPLPMACPRALPDFFSQVSPV